MSDVEGIQDDSDRYEEASEERFGEEEINDQTSIEGEAGADPWDKPDNPYKTKFEDKNKAFASERRKRQEETKRRIELEERLDVLETATRNARPKVEDEIPDELEDPIAAIAALKKLILDKDKVERESQTRTQIQSKEQRAAQEFGRRMADLENEFRESAADYDDAAKHFAESLRTELLDTGTSEEELDTEFGKELVKIARRAEAAGKNPAEVIYNLAKKRGFGLDKANRKLDKLAEGQKSGRSIGSAPSAAPRGEISWTAVAAMPRGEQRDKAFAKLREQARRAG